MQLVEIYLKVGGLPLGQLPFEESVDLLETCAKQHPELVGEYRSLIQRIEQLDKGNGSRPLKLVPSESNRSERLHIQQLLSKLIYMNIGSLYCERCVEMIAANRIIYESFKRGKHNERAASGKRFYCPQNHLLFEHLDINL